MFPHKTNPKVEDYDFDFVKDLLKEAGDLAKKYGQDSSYKFVNAVLDKYKS